MHAIVVLAKSLQATIKQMVGRVDLDLKAAMEMMKICPDKEPSFIGTFEFFVSVPDYQDPAANLDRSCPSSPITDIGPAILLLLPTTPTTSSDPSTKVPARSVASVSHGDGLLSFAVLVTLCGMLQL